MPRPPRLDAHSRCALCSFLQVRRIWLCARYVLLVSYSRRLAPALTPSRTLAVVMRYDGDILSAKPASLGGTFHIVLVDLKASKSTVEILQGLQSAYPFPKTDKDRALHELLGEVNLNLGNEALACMERGDAAELGALMNVAQREFDERAGPMCPTQLGEEGSPVLHQVLRYGPIQEFIHGGKGIGSQGDGTAQLLCKDEGSMQRVVDVLQTELGVECLKVTLS